MEKNEILSEFKRYIDPKRVETLKKAGLDLIEEKRRGAFVTDEEGVRLIDCRTDAGSFNLGRRHPRIVSALKKALKTYDIGNYLFFSDVKAELAKRLGEISPGGKLKGVTYCVSGGEAVDFSIRLARAYTKREKIVSAKHGYYGLTGFALAADDDKKFRDPSKPLTPGFHHVAYNDVEALRRAVTRQTAAVILEPVQGEGGVYVPDPGYLAEARQICDKAGALLIADEVQTGLGRTGRMFGVDHDGVIPDILTVAKSLSGGIYPISAVLYRPELVSVFEGHPFFHQSAFGGADLGCAVALETLNVIERDRLPEKAAKLAAIFEERLQEIAASFPRVVKEVRQKGLMIGIEFQSEKLGKELPILLRERGVLATFIPHSPRIVRLLPPLILKPRHARWVCDAIRDSVGELARAKKRRLH